MEPQQTPPAPATTGPLTAGAAFGQRYRILRVLGQGGMGVVYQAWDEELGLAVALKIIRPEVMSDPLTAADIERRFKRELLLARQVTHRHVVRIHDLGEVDGVKFLTMPFIEGRTLAGTLAQENKLPVGRALQIVREIADGLMAAHAAGVVHRDLKPENVMLDADGHAVIMDFGISRSLTGTGAGTAMGSVVGTLEYMSPEQAKGEVADQRADIYALGLMLYDMLVGRRRFATGTNALSEAMARMQHAPAPVRTFEASIPEPIERIVARCLEPDPAKRYQTVSDLVAELNRLDADGHEPIVIPRPWWVPPFAASWPRGVQIALAAAVALLIAGPAAVLVVMLARGRAAALPDAAPREPMSMLIADFQNLANDPVFEGSLEQALAIAMEGAPFITTFPRREAMAAAKAAQAGSGDRLDEPTARLVSQREGIKVVLAGAVASSGSGYRVDVRAIDAFDGKELAKASRTADGKPDVLRAVAEVASDVREVLGDVTPQSERLARAETLTASSLDAVKNYSVATNLASAGRDEEAIAYYRRAVEADPKFGRAFSGWAISAFTAGHRQEADEKWKEALALLDRMTDREKFRTLGSYYLRSGSYEQAIENYTELVNRYPADRAGHSNLALAYFYSLNFAKALEHGRKAIEIYPNIARFRNNQALYAMYAGDFETAASEARGVLTRDSAFHRARLPIAVSAVVAGNYDAARREYAEMQKGDARAELQGILGRADLEMYLGNAAEAVRVLESAVKGEENSSKTDSFGRKAAALSEASFAAGKPREAAAAARQAIDATGRQLASFAAVRTYVALGLSTEAAAIAAEWDQRLQTYPRAYANIVAAEIALQQRRTADAIRILRDAKDIPDVWLRRFLLGVGYVQAGAYAEALSELNRCQERRGEATAVLLDDIPTVRYLATLPYWLGRAQEGLRNPAAAASYEAFLKLRPNSADALAQDARRRLEAR